MSIGFGLSVECVEIVTPAEIRRKNATIEQLFHTITNAMISPMVLIKEGEETS